MSNQSNSSPYPIRFNSEELERLDTQSEYLFSSELQKIIQPEVSILDVGVGVGSLLNTLLKKNVEFRNYTGVDIDELAIQTAKMRFEHVQKASFSTFNVTNPKQDLVGEFDLIVIRLVLWSLTPDDSKKVLAWSMDKLRKGGKIYLLEPVDDQMHFGGERKQELQQLAASWKQIMLSKGFDLNFGQDLALLAKTAGFSTDLFNMLPITSYDENPKQKAIHIRNVQKLFNLVKPSDFESSTQKLPYNEYQRILKALTEEPNGYFFTECFYHYVGTKK